MSKLLNIKEFCKNLKEIKSSKITNNKGHFTEDGLFSEQIFGPVKNYTCQCGIFYGQSRSGKICEICKVEVTNSGERRKRFAKIRLPITVVNPIFYDLIINIGGPKNKLDELMTNEESILCKKNNKYYIIYNHNDIPDNAKLFEYNEAIYELISGTAKALSKSDNRWKYIYDNIDQFMIDEIIVLPADLRPASKSVDRKSDHTYIVDKINRYYRKLLIKKEGMEETYVDVKSSKKIYYDYYKQIQRVVNELYDYILNSLSKRDGLIRRHILGKRIDFSGRAVIVPDPTLNLDECKIPYFMFLELFKIYIAKALIEDGYYKFLNLAIQYIDKCILEKSYNLFDFCMILLKKNPQVCILNRQPSLHRLGMLGFKIKLENCINYVKDKNGNYIKTGNPQEPYKWMYKHSNVIKIHPLVCPCFNADFDGDQMAVYVPISKESRDEILNKFLVTKNFTNPANAELTTTPNQDIVLGIYALTSNKFPKLQNMVEFKGKIITEGRMKFNKCLPVNYSVIDYIVTKKELMNILNDVKDKYDEQTTAVVLDNIKRIGFEYASRFGPTMSLDMCKLKDEYLKDKIYQGEIIDQLNKISSKETEEYLRQNFGCSYMIDSGSRGSWDQVRQIILSRGFISNFKGEIIPTPVKSSLLDGLNPREFFISTHGCRKGLLDIALNTSNSGYLSRKLIFTCANLQKDLKLDDCGTGDFLNLYIDSAKKAEMLIFRYYLDNKNNLVKITKDNYKELIGKIIRLRSPIFCKSYNICHKCYGDLWKFLNTKFVGIISAQTLGERSTQLILRTFHTSLYEDTKILDINNNSYTIKDVYNKIKNGEDLYTFSCSPDGKIEVSKIINAYKDRFENKMIKITLDNNKIVKCTLDHKFIMKDGSYKKAEDLKVNDSLMSIYFCEDKDRYGTIKQNKRSRWNRLVLEIWIPNFLNSYKNNHKIVKIEFIELDKYKEFYDLTVNSKYHNFALESGIFIHNSGVANIKGEKKDVNVMKQDDIIADLSIVSKIFHHFDGKDYNQIINELFEIYNSNGKIHHIHIESVVSQLMWYRSVKWRLLKNRNQIKPEYYSIQKVPSYESWILGLGFSDPKRHIIKGLTDKGNYYGIMDKILLGKKL